MVVPEALTLMAVVRFHPSDPFLLAIGILVVRCALTAV